METLRKVALFWDVDRVALDEEQHADFIIRRVLMFGDVEDVRWMLVHYGVPRVSTTMNHARDIDKKNRNFWQTHLA